MIQFERSVGLESLENQGFFEWWVQIEPALFSFSTMRFGFGWVQLGAKCTQPLGLDASEMKPPYDAIWILCEEVSDMQKIQQYSYAIKKDIYGVSDAI